MTLAVGFVVVIVCVVGGYLFAHGNLAVLFQPAELIIIVGAAIGAMIIGTPMRVMKEIGHSIKNCFVSETKRGEAYLQLLGVIYELSTLVRTEGILSLEQHVETPDNSAIMKKIAGSPDLATFLTDALRMVLIGAPVEEIAEVIDTEMEIQEHETDQPGSTLATVADGLPGLGIVAAVLGIIITMNSIGGDSAAVGAHVAAALVGTFLGVLLAYGFVSPLSNAVKGERLMHFHKYKTLKVGILGIAKGSNPLLVCEAARHEIPSHNRPGMKEMENYVKSKKGA